MSEAGCPVCAESLGRLDVLFAAVEQFARGRAVAVGELAAVIGDALAVLGTAAGEVAYLELDATGGGPGPGWFAELDQAKARAAAAIRAACPCAPLRGDT